MQATSPRFETTLPKEHFFAPRPTQPPIEPVTASDRRTLWLVAIIGAAFVATVGILTQPPPAVLPAPPQTSTLRIAKLVDPASGSTTYATSVPRAQLIHVRAIGTFENDQMPDGRILGTLYKGELPSVTNLPRTGGQPGDMWFTRNDGHAWVLAPVAAGSQTLGWVDP